MLTGIITWSVHEQEAGVVSPSQVLHLRADFIAPHPYGRLCQLPAALGGPFPVGRCITWLPCLARSAFPSLFFHSPDVSLLLTVYSHYIPGSLADMQYSLGMLFSCLYS